jgi:hypothetical protein
MFWWGKGRSVFKAYVSLKIEIIAESAELKKSNLSDRFKRAQSISQDKDGRLMALATNTKHLVRIHLASDGTNYSIG